MQKVSCDNETRLPSYIRGAIFDLDGTLLDSIYVWQWVDKTFLGERGIEVPADYMKSIGHMSFKECADYTIARFGLKDSPQTLMQEWMDLAYEEYAKHVQLKPGAFEYLKLLKSRGFKLSVATASDLKLCIPCLEHNQVYEMFDAVVSSDEVERGKGFPDVYIRAAEKMGIEVSQCVVFEDITAGVQGAKAGDFYTVGVYDAGSAAEEPKIREIADDFFRGF